MLGCSRSSWSSFLLTSGSDSGMPNPRLMASQRIASPYPPSEAHLAWPLQRRRPLARPLPPRMRSLSQSSVHAVCRLHECLELPASVAKQRRDLGLKIRRDGMQARHEHHEPVLSLFTWCPTALANAAWAFTFPDKDRYTPLGSWFEPCEFETSRQHVTNLTRHSHPAANCRQLEGMLVAVRNPQKHNIRK